MFFKIESFRRSKQNRIYPFLKQSSGSKRNIFYQYSKILVHKFSFPSVSKILLRRLQVLFVFKNTCFDIETFVLFLRFDIVDITNRYRIPDKFSGNAMTLFCHLLFFSFPFFLTSLFTLRLNCLYLNLFSLSLFYHMFFSSSFLLQS